ncbi:tail fiber domain-containing protein [Roseovarius sp. D22-M7]|uniref:tail fiber domain-containing protein n=1 Tax=Roseovarius sp. D22-M7 TaxID=3127116 RepID=UPI0030103EB2
MRYSLYLFAFLLFSSAAQAADYTHGDPCTAAGAWHTTNDASSVDYLVCDGTNWLTAYSIPSSGNVFRLDDDPAIGNAGCLQYNGSSGRLEFSHDCTNYSVFGEPIWSKGAADDIYYNIGTPRVGVGTAAPSHSLDVTGTIRATEYMVINPATSPTTPNFFDLGDLSSVVLSTPANGETLQYNGTNWVNVAGGGKWLDGTGTDEIYYSAAHVGIGTDSPNVELDVVGDIQYTGVISDVSDRRLKDNISDLSGELGKIVSLQGVSFTMNDDPKKRVELGFIAQDVEEIYPTLVATDEKGFKSLNYQGLIAPMLEAIKEQQKEISALRAEIDTLKAMNTENVRPVSVEGQ